MPQLKHLARFTTPVNLNDAKDTPITSTVQPTLTFTETVRSILGRQTQPLSVIEITELVSRETKHAYDETYIRLALKDLVNLGKASSRKETHEERRVRAHGEDVSSLRATLFWSPAGIVPARTVAEAVPGLALYKPETFTARKIYKYPTKKVQREHLEAQLVEVAPVTVAASSNQVVDYLIEKMVTERTADIQAQLDAANAKLAKLQELFKSAL
jgi:phage tail protein X